MRELSAVWFRPKLVMASMYCLSPLGGRTVTWACMSMKPGSTQPPSITRTSGGTCTSGPISAIRPSRTRTVCPGRGPAPVPSSTVTSRSARQSGHDSALPHPARATASAKRRSLCIRSGVGSDGTVGEDHHLVFHHEGPIVRDPDFRPTRDVLRPHAGLRSRERVGLR